MVRPSGIRSGTTHCGSGKRIVCSTAAVTTLSRQLGAWSPLGAASSALFGLDAKRAISIPSTFGKPFISELSIGPRLDLVIQIGAGLGRRNDDGFDARSVEARGSRSRGLLACP